MPKALSVQNNLRTAKSRMSSTAEPVLRLASGGTQPKAPFGRGGLYYLYGSLSECKERFLFLVHNGIHKAMTIEASHASHISFMGFTSSHVTISL